MLTNLEPSFGVAGFPPNFLSRFGNNNRESVFAWLKEIGLNWIELQDTHGAYSRNVKDEQALTYKSLAEEYQINVSIHAPYSIHLASASKKIREDSKGRILRCFELAIKLESKHIIFHPGGFSGESVGRSRKEGLEILIEGLLSLEKKLPAENIFLYPETAGKKAQLGSIEEIIEICSHVRFAYPCIDLAHVHAFRGGTLLTPESISSLFDLIEERLGMEVLHKTHFHMYPVEVLRAGEGKHKAFTDKIVHPLLGEAHSDMYFPRAEHFAQAIFDKGLFPSVVCEAYDSQDTGAILIKNYYNEMR